MRGGGLTAAGEKGGLDVGAIVAGIIDRVGREGDAAVVELERELDRADLTPETLRVPLDALREAHAKAEPAFLQLIRRAASNIREYQRSILIKDPPPLRRGGRTMGVRYTPIRRAAVYVPGGRAFYPSTVLMTAVPAAVAGVPEIVITSPPHQQWRRPPRWSWPWPGN